MCQRLGNVPLPGLFGNEPRFNSLNTDVQVGKPRVDGWVEEPELPQEILCECNDCFYPVRQRRTASKLLSSFGSRSPVCLQEHFDLLAENA